MLPQPEFSHNYARDKPGQSCNGARRITDAGACRNDGRKQCACERITVYDDRRPQQMPWFKHDTHPITAPNLKICRYHSTDSFRTNAGAQQPCSAAFARRAAFARNAGVDFDYRGRIRQLNNLALGVFQGRRMLVAICSTVIAGTSPIAVISKSPYSTL